MDLGIAGRKAIVCASSRGLGAPAPRRWPRPAARWSSTAATRHSSPTAAADAQEDRRQGDPGCRRRRLARRPEGAVRRLSRAGHPGQQQCRAAVSRFPRTRPAENDRRRHRQYDRGHGADSEGDRPDGRQEIRPHRQHHLRLGQNADRRPRSVVRRARRPHRLPRRRGADASPRPTSPSISCCPAFSTPIASAPTWR